MSDESTPRCGTCAHWDGADPRPENPGHYDQGVCQYAVTRSLIGGLVLPLSDRRLDDESYEGRMRQGPRMLATVGNGEQYVAPYCTTKRVYAGIGPTENTDYVLVTNAIFGCVLHQAADKPTAGAK